MTNLLALLVSLAMMLTGAGGAVQTEALPVAQTARTLTLSNVSVTWNGETLKSGSHWFDHGECTGSTSWDW